MSHLLSKNLLLRSTLALLPDNSASFRHARIAVWESVSVSMIWRCLWISTLWTTKWQYVLYPYCILKQRIWSSGGQRLVSVLGWQSLRRTKTFVRLGQQCVLGMVKLTRICCSICWHILTFPELTGWLFSHCPRSHFLTLLYWQSVSGCHVDFTFWLCDVLSSMVKWEVNEEFMALLHNGLCCEQKSIHPPPEIPPKSMLADQLVWLGSLIGMHIGWGIVYKNIINVRSATLLKSTQHLVAMWKGGTLELLPFNNH